MTMPYRSISSIRSVARPKKILSVVLTAALLASCGGGDGDRPSTLPDPGVPAGPAWLNFGRDPQHSAQAGSVAAQPISRLAWRADIDLQPVRRDDSLDTGHYGSPVISGRNTVVLPVKVTSAGTFRVEARSGSDGALKWQADTDYSLPHVRAAFNVALTTGGRVYFPGAGGKLFYRDNIEGTPGAVQRLVFYGDTQYDANKAAMDAAITINTPLTVDAQGTVYFGFQARGTNPLNLTGGIVRIDAAGKAVTISALQATGDARIVRAHTGAAPALSPDGKTLYTVMSADATRAAVYLVALDSATLAVRNKKLLLDPATGGEATVTSSGTASPAVGPDGDVYYGINGTGLHGSSGWLLHFDATLTTTKAPGAFGWDFTPSIVPASLVGGYAGNSSYLIASKYNEYRQSQHRMAILDPAATQSDRDVPAVAVMKEVITVLSPTRDAADPTLLHEWCINTAAVDPSTKSVFMNNSDGFLYRWNLATNQLSEKFNMNSGYYQSYTPIALGPDGKVYSINNAVLSVVGN